MHLQRSQTPVRLSQAGAQSFPWKKGPTRASRPQGLAIHAILLVAEIPNFFWVTLVKRPNPVEKHSYSLGV